MGNKSRRSIFYECDWRLYIQLRTWIYWPSIKEVQDEDLRFVNFHLSTITMDNKRLLIAAIAESDSCRSLKLLTKLTYRTLQRMGRIFQLTWFSWPSLTFSDLLWPSGYNRGLNRWSLSREHNMFGNCHANATVGVWLCTIKSTLRTPIFQYKSSSQHCTKCDIIVTQVKLTVETKLFLASISNY